MVIGLIVFLVMSFGMFMWYKYYMLTETNYNSLLGTCVKSEDLNKLVDVVKVLNERVEGLEKWTVDISGTYNTNKERMINEMVGLSEWTSAATDMINDTKDDLDFVLSHLLDMSIAIENTEAKIKNRKRVVMSSPRTRCYYFHKPSSSYRRY